MDFPAQETDQKDERQAVEDRLQGFGRALAAQRDEWIRARYSSGADKRWTEDEDQYDNKDNIAKAASQMMTSVEQGYPVTTQMARPHRSTVYIGLTRQKTNAAEARLADILLPTDDRNWGITPTPDPKLMGLAKSDAPLTQATTGAPIVDPVTSQPLRMKDYARKLLEEAKARAEAMQTKIDDQLIECDYNGELRKVIHNAAKFGTGVLKGPIVTNKSHKSWRRIQDADGATAYVVEFVEDRSPASFSIDPRNVWPDPSCGSVVQNGRGIYELQNLTAKKVRDLAKQPGYIKSQLRKVLDQGPKRSAALQELKDEERRELTKDTYEFWEYWGEVDYEDLLAAGVEVGEEDPLKSLNACVIMINDTVVKAFLNPQEDDSLPYDLYAWEMSGNGPWGYGVPYLMRAQQKVLNAAWRQMMDNAGVSSGPQIVMKPSVITPADQVWQLTSRKIWYATDDVDDVNKAFAMFHIDSHQAELSGIIKMAMELADQETGVPVLAQGEKGAAPDTVGGMQLLMNSANVVLRRLVKQFDDSITRPHIRRYYDYNMLYSDEDDIKGDYTINARGSSALLIRDIQNQAMLGLLQAASSPLYGPFIDPEKLFRKALQAQHVDPEEIFKSEEEIERIKEQMRNPQAAPPDPRIAAAQIRGQADMARTQAQAQSDMAEIAAKQELTLAEIQFRREQLVMERDIQMLELANKQNMSLETIRAKLAELAIKERGKKELFAAERRLKMSMGSGI